MYGHISASRMKGNAMANEGRGVEKAVTQMEEGGGEIGSQNLI
jgi:hypothetical protein